MLTGFGKGTIHFPQDMFPTEGFCGVHDEPHVRVMVLGDALALAVMELVNPPMKAVEYCRKAMSEAFGTPYERTMVHMTHAITTPHEPGPMGPPDRRPPVTDEDLRKRALFYAAINAAADEAVAAAKESLCECRIAIGSTTCYANRNRDVEYPGGWWTGFGSTGVSDRTMTVLKAIDGEGKTAGVFVTYGLKPCAIDNSEMEKGTRLVSSECCGMACTMAEEALGAPVLYGMAAAGDQIPVKAAWLEIVEDGAVKRYDEGVQVGLGYAEEVGKMVCDSIVAAAEKLTDGESAPVTAFETLSLECDTIGRGRPGLNPHPVYVPDGGKATLTGELYRIGKAVILTERPEINAQTVIDLRNACPDATIFFMSMVNSGMKYLPDRLGYERGTFEASRAGVMPGAAETFFGMAAEKINALMEK